ncbi:MAG: threonine--tRNA ligase [Polyangiaceae bacterium]
MDHDDHRSIGKRLELFHFQEEAPGMVFWHPRGFSLLRELEEANRRYVRRHGYIEVKSPQLLRQPIWERSGHWQHFRENMFVLGEEDGLASALKPVSCPGHLAIARRMSLSYRDLPLRLSELGVCHRNEQSGALAGLFRLRQFVQDDGHILSAPEAAVEEIARFCASIPEFYRAFGFERVHVALASRPPDRLGGDESWDSAERALAEGARLAGLDFEVSPGGGAFYGPKLELALVDRAGRSWQCGTIQLDAFLPERFGVEYADASGARRHPVMLHRALCGSLERFLGIVLEHHRGRLPAWLSPDKVVVLPLRASEEEAARVLCRELSAHGLAAAVDASDENVGKRVAIAHAREIPYIIVIGPRELERGEVDVRGRAGREVVARDRIVSWLLEAARPPF